MNSRKSIHEIPCPLPNEITSSSAHTISTQRPTEAKINLFWRTKIDEGTPKSDPITSPLILQKEKKYILPSALLGACNSYFVQTNAGFILQQIKFTWLLVLNKAQRRLWGYWSSQCLQTERPEAICIPSSLVVLIPLGISMFIQWPSSHVFYKSNFANALIRALSRIWPQLCKMARKIWG